MRSTTNWMVLGLVIERPSYGYELSKRAERQFGDFFTIARSHVYAALDSLVRRAMIERMEIETGSHRQPKPHYRATAAGVRAYRGWLGRSMREDPRRVELMERLLSVHRADATVMLDVIAVYEQACLDEISTIALNPAERTVAPHDVALRLLMEERRLALQAQMQWIDYARRELRGADPDGAETGSARESR